MKKGGRWTRTERYAGPSQPRLLLTHPLSELSLWRCTVSLTVRWMTRRPSPLSRLRIGLDGDLDVDCREFSCDDGRETDAEGAQGGRRGARR